MSPNGLLTLAPSAPSREAVEALEQLLEQARAGAVVGVAWVALAPGKGYEVDAAGEALRDPERTRGLVGVLDDQLARLIGSR